MIAKPKVSIVIPVYNGSNFLKEAIDSALAQTYENIEVIVVNDGSNDNGATEHIAKSYGSKLKYYKKKNGGVATALNLGIEKMTGEYFSWLSHDDLYYSQKIEKQIEFIEKLEVKEVIIYADYALLQDSRIIPVELNHETLTRKPKYSLLRGSVNGITMLIPRSILRDTGEFDEKLRCTQDYDLWRRAFHKYEFVHMKEILSVTRIHGSQDSAVSPNVVKEGDILWKALIEELTETEKLEYESTIYNYYFEMSKFLRTTPYKGALEFCIARQDEEYKRSKKNAYNKLITVIIPFRDRLADTIHSIKTVENQTYKNIEIILVDDASTDDITPLTDYIKKIPHISLIKLKKNIGPAGARNVAIRLAKGEYIAFLDSDDEFLPEKIRRQIDLMCLHNLDISYSAYIRRSDQGETVIGGYGISGVVVPRIISSCPIATPTVMVRRDLLIKEGIFFNESMRIGEDTCFWLEIAKKYEILHIEEPLTIVNVSTASSAYDNKKLIVGLKNILTYLLSDKYYSTFARDISLLCNDYYQVNRADRQAMEEGLRIKNYWKPTATDYILISLRKSLPYLAARKFYRSGYRGVIQAVKNRTEARFSKTS